ncbi:MAG: hypothetical protein A3A08_02175 [Candidatus Nealsonbacteria bacterium RIFCSPLOWO2_01_FULL_41_9]|uniref:Cohesin domain-containing protein n=1 Tax=Candidatus Nealsonbacteria bacterium RIFCSPLOWO2_01_FULL_41_9 TaxID=1801671 RepID=A0A1G2ED28_9BACT|nr:MAG: hypothetical protein A3A08_02175 [Candidatus Nealsonbacteria bacterium RIFCSPLOWO2_01_FULL_41_9]
MKAFFALLFANLAFLSLPIESDATGQAKLFLSPSTGSFIVGSTFDVSVIVDTDEVSINTVKTEIYFPADYLQITAPSSGKSFFSLWLEQPVYSNIEGTISFAGGIPGGIKTSSGIVSTITFRAIKAGEAVIKILPSSNVLANDGKGTQILSTIINGAYTLKPKPPEGPVVFSQTHPDENSWYNNNNPVVSWEKEAGVTNFSFILDGYPSTQPDNNSDIQETTKAYENLADGLWYFHIKSLKENAWGATSNFLLRIDTTPPAKFKPKVEFLLAQIVGRAFVSFHTTDALSGIDRYEVAVIDKSEPPLGSPVFIEAESPYQLPKAISENLRVTVRAADKAGNIRDESADVNSSSSMISKLKNNMLIVFSSALIIAFFIFLITPFPVRQKIINLFEKLKSKISAKIVSLKRKGSQEDYRN